MSIAVCDRSAVHRGFRSDKSDRNTAVVSVVQDPIGLELVEEISLGSFRVWNIEMLGGIVGFPQSLIDAVRAFPFHSGSYPQEVKKFRAS